MRHAAAFTESVYGTYPAFINVSHEEDSVRVVVRSKDSQTAGEIFMTKAQFIALANEALGRIDQP